MQWTTFNTFEGKKKFRNSINIVYTNMLFCNFICLATLVTKLWQSYDTNLRISSTAWMCTRFSCQKPLIATENWKLGYRMFPPTNVSNLTLRQTDFRKGIFCTGMNIRCVIHSLMALIRVFLAFFRSKVLLLPFPLCFLKSLLSGWVQILKML